jgi:hypothetical protein
MQGILYRAVACVHGRDEPEVHVFFEAPPLTNPGEELLLALNTVWRTGRDVLEIYNIVDETELLRSWSVGGTRTGDARLFEVGVGDRSRVHYCAPDRTLFLVSPTTLQRLVKAQAAAQALACAGYTVDLVRAAA